MSRRRRHYDDRDDRDAVRQAGAVVAGLVRADREQRQAAPARLRQDFDIGEPVADQRQTTLREQLIAAGLLEPDPSTVGAVAPRSTVHRGQSAAPASALPDEDQP